MCTVHTLCILAHPYELNIISLRPYHNAPPFIFSCMHLMTSWMVKRSCIMAATQTYFLIITTKFLIGRRRTAWLCIFLETSSAALRWCDLEWLCKTASEDASCVMVRSEKGSRWTFLMKWLLHSYISEQKMTLCSNECVKCEPYSGKTVCFVVLVIAEFVVEWDCGWW